MNRRIAFILIIILLLNQSYGQKGVSPLSGGLSHTLYLCNNGTVFSWGDNSSGQLGRNPELIEDLNPGLVDNLKNITSISAGKGNFSMAIKSDSTLWTWGQNSYKQLGTDTMCYTASCEISYNAVQVKGGETGSYFLKNVISCNGGLTHCYALLKSGEVVAWGDNSFGQLGNGNTINQKFPVYVKKPDGSKLNNVLFIASGLLFGFAITSDGNVWGWGKNSEYELGCGNNQVQYFATPVVTSSNKQLSNIINISGGYKHAIFLSSNGIVYGTGAYKGETWINGTTFYSIKSYASQFTELSNVTDISAGFTHNIAITNNGQQTNVYSWGNNKLFPLTNPTNGGQLGNGNSSLTHTMLPQLLKTSIEEPISNPLWISASFGNSFVFSQNTVTGSTSLLGSGINNYGQLGTRDYSDKYSSVKIYLPQCFPNCPSTFLGDNKYLCLPIFDTLKVSNSNGNKNTMFKWYKNDTLLISEKQATLAINAPAKYLIEIVDTSKSCTSYSEELIIKQRIPHFTILNQAYCGDTVTFKTFNNPDCYWSTQRIFGKYLGSGSIITIPSSSLQTSLPDSSKIIWMFTSQCQPLKVTAPKNCNPCSIKPPTVSVNKNYCKNSSISISALGSNIHWYKRISNEIFSIENSLQVDSSIEATYYFLVTQSDSICESKPDTIHFTVSKCIKEFSIKGNILPAQKSEIIIYDYNNMPNILAKLSSDINGNYSFVLPENSKIYIQASATNSNQYYPTYFGNSLSISKAYPLTVDANIGDANINLSNISELIELKSSVNISPSIVTNYCIINTDCAELKQISIINSLGNILYTFQTRELLTFLNTSTYSEGLYFVKIDFGMTTITKYFIKK